jgi:hypothetical protein
VSFAFARIVCIGEACFLAGSSVFAVSSLSGSMLGGEARAQQNVSRQEASNWPGSGTTGFGTLELTRLDVAQCAGRMIDLEVLPSITCS